MFLLLSDVQSGVAVLRAAEAHSLAFADSAATGETCGLGRIWRVLGSCAQTGTWLSCRCFKSYCCGQLALNGLKKEIKCYQM